MREHNLFPHSRMQAFISFHLSTGECHINEVYLFKALESEPVEQPILLYRKGHHLYYSVPAHRKHNNNLKMFF